MDCEKEIMSENEEYSSCESSSSVENARTITEDNEQPWNHLQHANLLLEDTTSSETSWTNEKHSLYLNSIEDAFVSSLYQQGYYTSPCKRWQADRGEISSALSLDLNEEVESGFSDGHFVSGFPEESQSESEMPRIHLHTQNHSKRCILKKMGGSNARVQESDRNEKRNKRKFQNEVSDPGKQITHVWEELQSRHNDETASNFCAQDRFTQNRIFSGTISNNKDDQVVPSLMKNLQRKMASHDNSVYSVSWHGRMTKYLQFHVFNIVVDKLGIFLMLINWDI